MSEHEALERRYRRFLGWYPARHRSLYGDEMIGVLLAAASGGQRRPGLPDAINLLAGAARVRLRSATARVRAAAAWSQASSDRICARLVGQPDQIESRWQDALSLTSLLAPPLLAVLLLGQDLGWMARLLWHDGAGAAGRLLPYWPAAILLVPTVLGLLKLRRCGAVAAIAQAAWLTLLASRLVEPRLAAYAVLLGVQAVALVASPGPRHALRLISIRGVLTALPWLGAAAYASRIVPTHYPVPLAAAEAGIGIAALTGLAALASATGRRLIALLVVIPGSAFVVSVLTFANVHFDAMNFTQSLAAMYLPPAVLGLATATLIRRASDNTGRTERGAA